MIHIIPSNKPKKLPHCTMNCDKPLHEKLDKYPLTHYLNCHSTNLIIGQPGSGKSSLLYTFFKTKRLMRGVFDKIYLFRPRESGGSMKDDIFGDNLPPDQSYGELSYQNLDSVMNKIKGMLDKKESKDDNFCIVFDDMGSYLKNNETLTLFRELIYNRRHLHTSIYFLCQNYKSVHKDIRKLFNNIFIFKVNKSELDDIVHENIGSKNKNDLLDTIINDVFDKKHNFLFFNTVENVMFKNWDLIKIIM